jgi:AcrR family transcriptional regulator
MSDTDLKTSPDGAARKRRASIGAQRNPASAEAILDAAAALLRDVGYRTFTIEAVARRAGAGKPTIYRWWPTKAALLFDVYARESADAPALPDSGSLEKDLALVIDGLWRFWRDTGAGQAFRALVAECQGDAETVAELDRRQRAIRERTIDAVIARAVERGELPDDRARALGDLVTGFAWYKLLTGRLDDTASVAPALRVLMQGA